MWFELRTVSKIMQSSFQISGIRVLAACEITSHPPPGFNCLIRPGDSGKFTILDAIELCLGARRSAPFGEPTFTTSTSMCPSGFQLRWATYRTT
ncbi:hypothetical protein [Pseudomonas sp. NPDC096950]|uniref:hypothetical protein n=1 Tax=Pseudomonas sp. NPDC096950 TaxID=3364485 RepID=UPI00383A23EC